MHGGHKGVVRNLTALGCSTRKSGLQKFRKSSNLCLEADTRGARDSS
jgi:hypothetical protein